MERYWQLAVEGQKSETLMIACYDSRAIPEVILIRILVKCLCCVMSPI
nr:hypothetical protein BAR15_180209 [Bartonella sp. AR 15-3]